MIRFFLRIYDYLAERKWLAVLMIISVFVCCGLLAGRLDFEEDIAGFLPGNEESSKYSQAYNDLSETNNIVLIFSLEEPSEQMDSTSEEHDPEANYLKIENAMEDFGVIWDETDTTGLVTQKQIKTDSGRTLALIDEIYANSPVFMTESDYRRIDSLLEKPSYVKEQLEADRQALMFPSGNATAENIRQDPLHLFTPLLQRLRTGSADENYTIIDDCIFTKDGKGIAFLTSPFGTSESRMNSEIASLITQVTHKVEEGHPGIKITAVGAPVIAATNASQIKKDSILAISIAFLLIGTLLILTYRRVSDIFWILVSTAFGWILALGAMALLRQEMSIIVLGVTSVIIGIAVNYPLHFMDGLKTGIPARQNLSEMVEPLLIGNITTIAAFLCLVFLNAVAMHDMGLFASLMLAGTIIFVLIFLPLFVKTRNDSCRTVELGKILPEKVPSGKWLFFAVMAATVVLGIFSTRAGFDSDMQNINYMTKEQKEGLRILAPHNDCNEMFAMAEGATLEEALERNDKILHRIDSIGSTIAYSKGAGNILPSVKEQQKRIARWNEFWAEDGKACRLLEELAEAGKATGFAASAFEPFASIIENACTPKEITPDSPLAGPFLGTSLLHNDEGYRISNRIYYRNIEDRETIKSALDDSGVLVFDTKDISSNLASLLSENFDFIGIVCSLAVFIFLCLSFRRLELSLVSFLPLAVSWFWILGIMGLLDIRFNIVNIILATFIFGQGDDYTIFITEAMIYEYAYGRKRLSTYKNSIFNSALIMFIGIGALVLAKHPAMHSLGVVTVIGMFVVVMMAYYLPPAAFKWLTEKNGEKRDVPVTLGRLLRSLYAIIAFVLIMFLFVYPYTFFHFLFGRHDKDKTAESYHLFIQKLSRFIVMHIPGVKFTMSNPHGTTFDKPAVIVANHQSHFDAICMLLMHPKLIFATNNWVWNNPLYGFLLHKAECYPIADGIEKNLEKIRDLTSRGYSIIVFPEGTRTDDGSIGRFHRGAFYASQALGLDIIPVCIHGADHVLPKKDFMLRKGSIHLEIGRRMSPVADYREASKSFRHDFITWHETLRKRLETPGYFADYVMSKYLYKGADIEMRARKAIKNLGSAGFISEPDSSGKFVISGCGIGVYSLIYALTHPHTEVFATDENEEDIMIASNCSCLPANLHYSVSEKDSPL